MTRSRARQAARASARSDDRLTELAQLQHHLALSAGFLRAGDHAKAIPSLVAAARLAPSDGRIFNNLGLAYLSLRRFPEAIDALRRAVNLCSDGRADHNLGLALVGSGDAQGAIEAFRRAVARSPELARAHGRLADLLWDTDACADAAASYERAFHAEPETSFGRFCKAMSSYAVDRHGDAEVELRRLLAREPTDARALRVLGGCLQELGRLDEAAECLERCIALAPDDAGAYLALVNTRRLTEAERHWLTLVLERLDALERRGPSARPDAAGHELLLHFAAGKALDDLDDPEGAMGHFGAASAIRNRICPFDRRGFEEHVERSIARFTPEFFAAHAALGDEDATPLLIVGMPRSGTTLLERVVSSHPAVRGRGELGFWSTHAPTLAQAGEDEIVSQAPAIRADYLRLLRTGAGNARRVTDKMPLNHRWVGLIHLLFPHARFLHSRRDAVDTCLSIHMTSMRLTRDLPCSLDDLVVYHRGYRRLMDHWRAVLPPDRFVDVDYEEVVAQPEVVARKVIAFAGLPWNEACLHPESNPHVVKTANQWQARQPIYRSSVERWRRFEPWLGALRSLSAEEPQPYR